MLCYDSTTTTRLRDARDLGLFEMTKQDLLDALRGQPKAACAIFWWAYAWHSGVDSDLYKIMCDDQLGYIPDPKHNWSMDPEVTKCFAILDAKFGPLVEHAYQPVKLADVKEGQVLIAGKQFACITNRWPCRVYRHHGALGVACSGGVHGIKLLPGSETTFHELKEDRFGYVIGFRR
jgi:hypothetical protein